MLADILISNQAKQTQLNMAEEKKANETEEKVAPEAQEPVKDKKAAKKAEKAEKDKSKQKIEELEAEIASMKDSHIRLMAEFENFRRRNTQEKLELVSSAAKDTIMGLLPTLDDCERAMKVLEKSEDSAAAKEGTEMIYNKLMAYLKSKGLEKIEAMGQAFDTDLHEAVAQFPAPEESLKGKVFDVTKTGYTLNGKVIRFAQVVVGI